MLICWPALVGWRFLCVGAFGGFLLSFLIAFAFLAITSLSIRVLLCAEGCAFLFQSCIGQLAQKTGKAFQQGATCPHAKSG